MTDNPHHHTPFLRQVADIYAANESEHFSQLCFIFPNKRSATFFRHYLSENNGSGTAPNIRTITSFVSELSRTNTASKLEQIFILFDEYRKLSGDSVEFDQFLFWGEMILSDFGDVDRYLVDADSLFVNLKRYKEISSNYLTPEQIEIIRRYWGEEPGVEYVDRFWKHFGNSDKDKKKPSDKFLRLWEALCPLYHAFNDRLDREGKSSGGMMYRKAAAALSDAVVKGTLKFKRYIFVGFNVLTPVELKIFSTLRGCGAADFYWDYNCPAFSNGFNRAGRFIERNIKEFQSLYPLSETPITTLPDIEIIGVPSAIAQTKVTASLLSDLAKSKDIADPMNAVDTAVVLPDESLFVALRRAIPYDDIPNINVTMGLPMKLTSVASLMRMIVSLQLRARHTAGAESFFYKDVAALLADPAIKNIAADQADALAEAIIKERLFRVTPAHIAEIAPDLTPVFTVLGDHGSADSVYNYISDVIKCISTGMSGAELKFLDAYTAAVDKIREHSTSFGVRLLPATFFRMVERIVASEKINLVGEPLKGLQIMGVLETRALDFDNIIMLSLNERIFPRKHYSGTFIPDALRRGYGIATSDFQESIFAYYFYRLISRARKVKLLYDARTIGVKTGEMSRYLTQLIYLFGKSGKIKQSLRVFEPRSFADKPVCIEKNNRIITRLKQYLHGAESPKYLSASAINKYVACPLQFYLSYVEGYNADEEMKDCIDSSMYGTIVHDTCESLYKALLKNSPDHKTVTRADIEALIARNDTRIERTITRIINSLYNKFDNDRLDTALNGQSLIMGNVIKESVKAILTEDLKLTPFIFEGAEENMIMCFDVNPNLRVNFKQKIDRIDIVGGVRRIVDYKTGDERTSVTDLGTCFDHAAADHRKAVAQILLYCYASNIKKNSNVPLKPYIYNLRKILSSGPLEIKINRRVVEDHRTVMDEFVPLLFGTIEEIFNPDIPFVQTDNEATCKFCGFKTMCGRCNE